MSEYKEIRKQKQKNWAKIQTQYPDKFLLTHKTSSASLLEDGTRGVKIAGRLMLLREMGSISFGQLQDFDGNIQISFKKNTLEKDNFDFILKNLDLGDIIGIEGEIFTTQKGEKTLNVEKITLLSKCLHPLPEKWSGIADEEQKLRKRYLDILKNNETKNRFKARNKIIKIIRNFLEENEFIEVETPILQAKASGALAKPFQTHHSAMNIPLFLRIAPETYLKRLMVAGYERIFEIGKSFRNEGIDSSHLQEFTMMEFYAAYWNYKNAIDFVEEIFKNIFSNLSIEQSFVYQNKEINCTFPWKRISYKDLFQKYTNLDLEILLKDEKKLWQTAEKLVKIDEYKSIHSLIDAIYKKHCRPNLMEPHIITEQPSILGPLARSNDQNPTWSDRFQIVINGWEVVNAYSELIDPEKQKNTLEEQAKLQATGEDEIMEMEEDFIQAMEHAMPPMAGVGIGIDRVVALLTNASTLRDTVFFPNLK